MSPNYIARRLPQFKWQITGEHRLIKQKAGWWESARLYLSDNDGGPEDLDVRMETGLEESSFLMKSRFRQEPASAISRCTDQKF